MASMSTKVRKSFIGYYQESDLVSRIQSSRYSQRLQFIGQDSELGIFAIKMPKTMSAGPISWWKTILLGAWMFMFSRWLAFSNSRKPGIGLRLGETKRSAHRGFGRGQTRTDGGARGTDHCNCRYALWPCGGRADGHLPHAVLCVSGKSRLGRLINQPATLLAAGCARISQLVSHKKQAK
jgi:hypothetical protein